MLLILSIPVYPNNFDQSKLTVVGQEAKQKATSGAPTDSRFTHVRTNALKVKIAITKEP